MFGLFLEFLPPVISFLLIYDFNPGKEVFHDKKVELLDHFILQG
jgi:hypothetical protein